MRLFRTLLLAGACAAPASTATAEIITVTPSKDTTIYQSTTGALANGAGAHLFVGKTSRTNNIRRALLAFDVSSIPAGSTINSVSMTLAMTMTVSGPSTVSAHRLLADWGEGSSDAGEPGGTGAPAQTGDATWIHRFLGTSGANWTTPGGDFLATASGSAVVDQANFYTWSSQGMVADVQAWVDGAQGNFGWIFLGNEAVSGSAKRFGSRENSDPLGRPRLTIDFTPIPAPGGVAVLGLGALLLARRRR